MVNLYKALGAVGGSFETRSGLRLLSLTIKKIQQTPSGVSAQAATSQPRVHTARRKKKMSMSN
jgi:hypothetical protein